MTAIDTHGRGHDHEHPPFLAHHFKDPEQQFEAGKLGMWLFLATEFLLFGGLFVAYAVFRSNRPEIFEYGSQFLDTRLGAINTVVLIASSLTMALAVTAAQLGKRRALIILLSLTFLGGLGFMGIKYVEYSHKLHYNIKWGPGFYAPAEHAEHADGAHDTNAAHAANAVEEPHADEEHGGVPATGTEVAADVGADDALEFVDGMVIPKSAIPPAARGDSGLAPLPAPVVDDAEAERVEAEALHDLELNHATDPDRPANAHIFFGIYFVMTGLHGIHVLVGMAVIGWLIWRSWRGDFGRAYFTPVDLGGLYWHVVDMIWIFLFPLLYLIG